MNLLGTAMSAVNANPYALAIKAGLALAIVGVIFGTGFSVAHKMASGTAEKAKAALDAKTKESAALQAKLDAKNKELDDYVALNANVAAAVKNIRVVVNSRIEGINAKTPTTPIDNLPVVAVPAGMLAFRDYTASMRPGRDLSGK